MAVKVLIRRRVETAHACRMRKFLSALESWAARHTGYFYGENLENPESPGEYLCIATWRSIESFNQWVQSTPYRLMEQQMALACGMCSESAIYMRPPHC